MTSQNRLNVQSILTALAIYQPPVDIEEVARFFELRIIKKPMPNEMSAFIHIDKTDKFIVVNNNHTPNRQRFSIAHEIGHYVNGHSYQDIKLGSEVCRYFEKHFQQEAEADRFAAEMLMPSKFFKIDIQKTINEENLSKKYLVSVEAIRIRLYSLRAVSGTDVLRNKVKLT